MSIEEMGINTGAMSLEEVDINTGAMSIEEVGINTGCHVFRRGRHKYRVPCL